MSTTFFHSPSNKFGPPTCYLIGLCTGEEVGGSQPSGNNVNEWEAECWGEGGLKTDYLWGIDATCGDTTERNRIMTAQVSLYIDECIKMAHSRGERMLYE